MIIFRLLDVFLMISHCKVNVTNSLLGLEQLSFLDMILVVRAISFLNFPLTWFLSHAIFYFTKLFFLSNTHQVQTLFRTYFSKYFHDSSLIYVPLLQVIPMSVQQPFIFLFILINTILIRLPSHLITLKTITITWPHTLI